MLVGYMITVAIPYRQAKNSKVHLYANLLLFKLQFLIGRLKTGFFIAKNLEVLKLQFLIGRLKTIMVFQRLQGYISCNSL